MLKIYNDRNKKFQFSMEVEGAEKIQGVRMIFEDKDNKYGIFLNAYKDGNKMCVDIPAFNGYNMNEGSAKIEVIADGMILNPWNDKFLVENSVKFNIEKEKPVVKNNSIKIVVEENKILKEQILYEKVVKSFNVLNKSRKNNIANRYKSIKYNENDKRLLESFDFIKDKNSITTKLFLNQLKKRKNK